MIDLFSLRKQFHLFLKNKLFVVLYIVMLLTTLVPLTFFIVMGADVVYTFYVVTRFIFYESLLFMIISYLFLILDRKSKIGEALQVMTHNRKQYMRNTIQVLGILLLFYNILLLIILLVNALVSGEMSNLAMLLKNEYVLNVLSPQIVYFLITIMLSQFKNFKLSSILFIIVTVLFSPLPTKIEFIMKPIIPIDTIIYYIHLPFALFLQYTEYSLDYLYGFQNELYKISSIIFWLVLSIIYFNKNKIVRNKIKMVSVLIVAAICFSFIYYPQDIYRMDNRWNGTLSDYNYYDVNNRKTYLKSNEMSNEYINSYNLDIDIKSQLHVEGTLDLILENPDDECVLTLYRNYKIKDLTSKNLKSYRQDGDYIYLKFNKLVKQEKIKVSYSGYHDIAFSNYQATQLPGYFPWYPMEGKKNIYFNNGDISIINYGLNPYNRIKGANFILNLNTNYPIISNLQEKGNNIFEGFSDSLTLLGGNVKKLPVQQETSYQIINYFPYRINKSYTINDYLNDINKSIDSVKKDFKNIYNKDLDIFNNKKIIICSNSLYRNQQNGHYAEFDDYILMSEKQYIDIMYFINYHMQYRKDIPLGIIEILPWIDQYNSNDQRVLSELMTILDSRAQSFETSDNKDDKEEFDSIRGKYLKAVKYMKEHIKKYGEEGAMRELGKVILEDYYGY